MTATIRLPANMRGLAGDTAAHQVEAATVGEAIQLLCNRFPDLHPRLLNHEGEIQAFVNVFVDNKNLREIGGAATPVATGTEILIVAALAGG